MNRRTRGRWLFLALAVGVPLAALANSFRAAPLPAPPELVGELPPASPPAEMALVHLPTGLTRRSAGFAYRGGAFSDRREFTMSAALVRHPRGDVLIDTGFGRDIDAHFGQMPLYFRATTRYEAATPAAQQLGATGYARARLRGILLTHAHWDHVSGVPDFPGTPVLVPAEERAFIAEGGSLTAVAREFAEVRYEEYRFDGGPYLGFPASHDLYGDGAIVVVPAFGHTPGSVIVFVTLPGERRYAFLGDLVWQLEGITQRAERAWPLRVLADADAEGVRENLLRVAAIAARFPEIVLVPAHDARSFASLPRL
ncbi:MBL fold metallo-hydrolase [Nannocystis pusilla]|uniref:MBL fold metallo-hydrolase n=1 Tax=Nannocystis pusilla TaxID=889268 RepID=UPI003DA4A981